MNDGPLEQLPIELSAEAELDKQRFLVSMFGLKGKARKDAIDRFVDRYHEMPHIPDLGKPI